jgi:hypothetical protein
MRVVNQRYCASLENDLDVEWFTSTTSSVSPANRGVEVCAAHPALLCCNGSFDSQRGQRVYSDLYPVMHSVYKLHATEQAAGSSIGAAKASCLHYTV